MLNSSPIPKQTVGRTFFYSIVTLGVVALIQLGAVCWSFIRAYHSGPREAHIAFRTDPTPAPQADGGAQPQANAQSSPQDPLALQGPTPIPSQQAGPAVSPATARLNELLTLASALEDRGDMNNALTHLREAYALAPEDPRVLSELATAYEKIGAVDKAMDLWQQIFKMGKAAGSYYDMASTKLVPPDSTPDAESKHDDEGFLPGSVLAIASITRADSLETPGKKFSLNVPVKARPGALIDDVHAVTVYVIFYEQTDDKTIVQTNANVTNNWITTPIDWNQNNIQILQVGYSAAMLDKKTINLEPRTYYGYIARVYYKGQLQDAHAEPASLLTQFPPSKEDDQ